MELKKNYLVPVKWVSVDHFQSTFPGRLYNSNGHTDDKDILNCGCIFVDHLSGYIHVWHQVTFSAYDNVKSKLLYGRDSAKYGVCIQVYNIDNGVFTSKYFTDELIENDQHIRFSGASSDHQNVVEKYGIQTVIRMTCIMLVHSAMRIPQGTITAELYPMAIDHAVWLYKKMPREYSGLSTYELWSRSYFLPSKDIISTFHTWSSPAYVI